jgi:ABC-type protease/lipase transport system fused ATPase/permease subunit
MGWLDKTINDLNGTTRKNAQAAQEKADAAKAAEAAKAAAEQKAAEEAVKKISFKRGGKVSTGKRNSSASSW